MDCWVSYTYLGFQLFSENSENPEFGCGKRSSPFGAYLDIFASFHFPSAAHTVPNLKRSWDGIFKAAKYETASPIPVSEQAGYISSHPASSWGAKDLFIGPLNLRFGKRLRVGLRPKGGRGKKGFFLFARCMARLTLVCQKWTRKKKRGKRQ